MRIGGAGTPGVAAGVGKRRLAPPLCPHQRIFINAIIASITPIAMSPHSDSVGAPAASPPTAVIATGVAVDDPPPVSSVALTLAVFVMVPLVPMTCTFSVIVAEALTASVPRVQESGFALLQVPCDGVALTNCSDAGSVSV